MLEQHPHLAQWEDLCVAHMLIPEFQVDLGMGESGEMKLSWVCFVVVGMTRPYFYLYFILLYKGIVLYAR